MFADHGIGDALRFEPGEGGLTRAVIDTDACTGEVYLHGAHVTHWQPILAGRPAAPVLFMSSKTVIAEGKAIRGGVPICFPWFGPHPGDSSLPAHGSVRMKPWNLLKTSRAGESVTIELETDADDLHAVFAVAFGSVLTMTLTATNRGAAPRTISEALHTYLQVGDVRHVHVAGLEGTTYQDKTRDNQRFTQDTAELRLTGRTDRVYLGTEAACVLHDPDLGRRIVVEKQGSRSTVVWNIWSEMVGSLKDMGEHDWPHYLCIETANALDDSYTLAPGASHTISAAVRVEPA